MDSILYKLSTKEQFLDKLLTARRKPLKTIENKYPYISLYKELQNREEGITLDELKNKLRLSEQELKKMLNRMTNAKYKVIVFVEESKIALNRDLKLSTRETNELFSRITNKLSR